MNNCMEVAPESPSYRSQMPWPANNRACQCSSPVLAIEFALQMTGLLGEALKSLSCQWLVPSRCFIGKWAFITSGAICCRAYIEPVLSDNPRLSISHG